MRKFYFLFIILLLLVGCSSSSDTINYVEAKEKIINNGAMLIDVRTKEEYDEKHIDGAVSLPLDNIESDITNVVNDKNTEIIVYCKSGARSHEAYELLLGLGYKKTYDLGAMDNWRE